MERKHIPETEHRLLLLYTLQKLGPVTNLQLLQAMSETDQMNYITMQLALSGMEEQQQITLRAHPLGSLIELTEEGKFLLTSFRRKIPASRRKAVDDHADEWKLRFQTEQMAPAASFRLPDGRMAAHLQLLDSAATLLDLLLYLPAGETLTLLSERWSRSVQGAYSAVFSTLADGYDPTVAFSGPVPDCMRPSGPNDWLLTLSDHPARPTIDLMLSLQDEHLARYFAEKWPSVSAALRDTVLDMLRGAEV